MSLIQHIENHLGVITQGWKDNDSEFDIQIISFKDCPGETVSTFLSLGMSDQVLEMGNARKVRQELVFSAYTISISSMIVSFLMSLCESIIRRGKGVLRGEVIPLSSELVKRIGFDAVYCSIPIFFEDDFCSYDESSPSTVMVMVVPIYQSEADYIDKNGWGNFENLLEEKDPDLCSMERGAVI
jgi:hypothetical protein